MTSHFVYLGFLQKNCTSPRICKTIRRRFYSSQFYSNNGTCLHSKI